MIRVNNMIRVKITAGMRAGAGKMERDSLSEKILGSTYVLQVLQTLERGHCNGGRLSLRKSHRQIQQCSTDII